ncbi:MAG: hypothetical protein IKE75_03085 [Bacilli bacterium]|nr:hypothetical protein [Bacilli bacterium]
MQNFKYLLFIICLYVFIPFGVKADCDYSRTAELSKIAGNVQFSYGYDVNNAGTPDFSVYVTNITNDIYVRDNTTGVVSSGNEFVFQYDFSGKVITYDIYSNDVNCPNQKLHTVSVSLPYYNLFTNMEQCDYYPDFKYCQKWFNTVNLTHEKFNEEFEKYYNEKNNFTSATDKIYNMDNAVSFLSENLIAVIMVTVCIFLIPLLFYLKRRMSV